jgi:hypothetical protein
MMVGANKSLTHFSFDRYPQLAKTGRELGFISYICEKQLDMILERTQNEILVRLPAYVDLSELQNMIDYLQYKELTAKSKATQSDVDKLSEAVNKSMWKKIKTRRGLI